MVNIGKQMTATGKIIDFPSAYQKYTEGLTDQAKAKLERLEAIWPLHHYFEELSETFHEPAKLLGDQLDRSIHALMARITMGISPASVFEAYADWLSHLAISPGRQSRLLEKAFNKQLRLYNYALCSSFLPQSEPCVKPLDNDPRFSHHSWQIWPYNIYQQNFLLTQQWWYKATTGVRGVSKHHENMVEFGVRQILDMFSPSNFWQTNPEVQMKTIEEGGTNLMRGFYNWLDDLNTLQAKKKPAGAEKFEVGKNLAATKGKVVFRNRLIELIQYEPLTDKVKQEPILVVPAWIMKYYILDLSQQNSLFKYLIEQGYTVYAISWHNPTSADRELSMEDYRELGIEAALDAVEAITGQKQVHAIGYCLGGTLLSITAAVQARERRERFKSICLLAAQTDFSEAGELMLFIDQSQITFLEDMMWHQGVLENSQMAGAFQVLRSNDLVWSRLIHQYMMGESSSINDLMAWNADATRMPYKMHSQYLRHLFLNNELARGQYIIEDRPISITDIRAPLFCVGTEKDHVAPWKSVYKVHILSDTTVTFVLTKGGHNAGIVSEPGHPRRHYRVSTRTDQDTYLDPDRWIKDTPIKEGSWWLEFSDWLAGHSGAEVDPPAMGSKEKGYPVLCDAPGTYVFEH